MTMCNRSIVSVISGALLLIAPVSSIAETPVHDGLVRAWANEASGKVISTVTVAGVTAFHISGYGTDYDPNKCMGDFYGEVVNNCSDTQRLYYPVSMIKTGNKTITINDGVDDPVQPFSGPFTCTAYSLIPGIIATQSVTFTARGQSLAMTMPFTAGGGNWIQVSCDLPPGDAVASVTWNQ